MKIPWEIKIGNIAQYLAISSFAIGTILFMLTFILTSDFKNHLIVIGFYYVGIVLLINLLYLIIMIISLFVTEFYHEYIIKKGFIMLANIPIAILYFFILINFI